MQVNLKNLEGDIEDLVIKVKQGDQDSFGKLYDIFINPLYKYLFFCVDRSDIEDLALSIFVKVWEKIKYYQKTDSGNFKSWFFKLAKNHIIDFVRSNKKVYELPDFIEDISSESNPKNQVKQTFQQEKLKKCLANINEHYSEFLTLKFLGDLSNKEISVILSKTEDGLRVLQFRALSALKKEIEAQGGIDF